MRNPICLIFSVWETLRRAPAGTWVDGCDYAEEGTYTNCTVQVLKCARCGAYSVSWSKNPESILDDLRAEIQAKEAQFRLCAAHGGNTASPPPRYCPKCVDEQIAGLQVDYRNALDYIKCPTPPPARETKEVLFGVTRPGFAEHTDVGDSGMNIGRRCSCGGLRINDECENIWDTTKAPQLTPTADDPFGQGPKA